MVVCLGTEEQAALTKAAQLSQALEGRRGVRVLRRKYKEQLLQEVLDYPYALNPAEIKK